MKLKINIPDNASLNKDLPVTCQGKVVGRVLSKDEIEVFDKIEIGTTFPLTAVLEGKIQPVSISFSVDDNTFTPIGPAITPEDNHGNN